MTPFSGDSAPPVRGADESLRKEGKKKFARMEQTLNKHEDIKRESINLFIKSFVLNIERIYFVFLFYNP